MTGVGSFDAVLSNDICLRALKAVLNLRRKCDGVWYDFCSGTGPFVRLHSKINTTVYYEILKKHVPNLRIAINQPGISIQGNTPFHTTKSV